MTDTIDIPSDLKLEKTFEVLDTHSADHLGSGTVAVLSTPSMILFMEITARTALEPYLPSGYSSVGIEMNIKHLKAVRIGEEVNSIVELIDRDRKKITFKVEVRYDGELVGTGDHTRFIIEEKEFLSSILNPK